MAHGTPDTAEPRDLKGRNNAWASCDPRFHRQTPPTVTRSPSKWQASQGRAAQSPHQKGSGATDVKTP